MTQSELRPCPFCDSNALHIQQEHQRKTVTCTMCGASAGINAWNTRALPTLVKDDEFNRRLAAAIITETRDLRDHCDYLEAQLEAVSIKIISDKDWKAKLQAVIDWLELEVRYDHSYWLLEVHAPAIRYAIKAALQAPVAAKDCDGLVEAAEKVNRLRHADNAVGNHHGFVPDRTDKAIDELEQALAAYRNKGEG